MKTITEKTHIDRLNKMGIVIEDVFLRKGKELIRRSDGKILDEVFNGARIRKKYFYNDKCIYTENEFDKLSNYTFVNYNNNDSVKCPNCSAIGNLGDFYEGCPYCCSNFNIDYNFKRYDLSSTSKNDKSIGCSLAFIFLGLPIIIPIFFFVCQAINNIPLFFITMFLIIIYIIFRKRTYKNIELNKSKIMSCLNYELNHYYYSNENHKDLIDFHITKYNYIKNKNIDDLPCIELEYEISKYYFINNEIIKKVNTETAIMKNNEVKNKGKHNIIECDNCGATIDIIKGKCEYCNTIISKNIEWSLIKLQGFDKINKE